MVYPIKQQLLVAKKIGPFERSIRNPQALAQGKAFLRAHYPDVATEMTASTAHVARYVSRTSRLGNAAIALAAASEYGLEVQAKDIQEIEDNYTRFDFRGNRASDLKNFKSGPSKVSLALDFAK